MDIFRTFIDIDRLVPPIAGFPPPLAGKVG